MYQIAFGAVLEVLGHYFIYFWGPGPASLTKLRNEGRARHVDRDTCLLVAYEACRGDFQHQAMQLRR